MYPGIIFGGGYSLLKQERLGADPIGQEVRVKQEAWSRLGPSPAVIALCQQRANYFCCPTRVNGPRIICPVCSEVGEGCREVGCLCLVMPSYRAWGQCEDTTEFVASFKCLTHFQCLIIFWRSMFDNVWQRSATWRPSFSLCAFLDNLF